MLASLKPVSAVLATATFGAALVAGCGEPPQGAALPGFPPAQVTTEVVRPTSYPVSFEYVGQVIGSKDAEVRPRVTGIVERRLFQEGAWVKAGQALFQIDPKPYQAQLASAEAEVARAEAERARAEREVARLKPLAERRAIGQKEADDAQSQAELAAAALKAAQARATEARLNLSYSLVTAPIAGMTSRAQQSEGSVATANQTLLTTISQLDPIWVSFSVSENERLALERARAAGTLKVPNGGGYDVALKLADGSIFPRKGRINFADTRINPQTGTSEMRATVPNADGALKPGQFVRVVLNGAERPNALAVPQVAVMEGMQGKFVYVPGKDPDGRDVATPRPVVAGEWTSAEGRNLWIIESGLNAGDRVIVDGVARLMPGAPISVASAGAEAQVPASPPDRAASWTDSQPASDEPRTPK
jgi:membrane fusion protein (multidrug efflux system)